MEQLEKFQIIFNNPSAIYNAGDTVYGYGWAVFKEPLHVQSKCQGHSCVINIVLVAFISYM